MNEQASFDPKDEILAAADGLAALAASYEARGFKERSDRLYRQCADLELASDGLQACWGGPLNGQVGRQRMIVDLITNYRPTCIVETGTFRGLSTAWLAERFSGPIWTCEASKRFYYQAEHNLSRHDHVTVSLSDSRHFLNQLDAAAPASSRPLFYLDAHWEQDLPLREELKLIMRAFPQFVVVIDDFKVPHDSGYAWDDYGEGHALTIAYFDTNDLLDCQILFPTLPASDETGARRGCCVISRHLSFDLEAGGLLRSRSLDDWMRIETDHHGPSVAAPVSSTQEQAMDVDWSRRSYPDQIAYLLQHLKAAQSEHIAKELVINDLRHHLDLSSALLDAKVAEKEKNIAILQKICNERFVIIESLASMSVIRRAFSEQ